MQARFVIVSEHGDSFLREYRPGIDAFIDQMHGRTGQSHPVREGVGDRVGPGKRGQQSWVGVDDAASKSCQESASQDFHEPGADDEIRRKSVDDVSKSRIPLGAVDVVSNLYLCGPDARALRMFEGSAVTVGDDGDDICWIFGGCCRGQ